MLDSTLTLEKELNQLVEVEGGMQWEIGEYSSVARCIEKVNILIKKALEVGLVEQRRGRQFGLKHDGMSPVEGTYDAFNAINRASGDLGLSVNTVISYIRKIGFIRSEDILKVNSTVDSAVELVLNAVEHGSDFCEEGPVIVTALHDDKRMVLAVNQPGGMTDGLRERLEKGAVPYETDWGEARGNGFVHFCNEDGPLCWVEETAEGGLIAVLVETRERLENV